MIRAFLALLLACAAVTAAAQEAPGPHLPLTDPARLGPSFRSGERWVAAYYFYWYDVGSREHLIDSDGSDALQDHPERLEALSYRDPAWHRQELLDMAEAGIDVALPVFWGVPGRSDDWNFVGLRALVEARAALVAEGRAVPRLGLFYDTTTLDHVDLGTEAGARQFVFTVRDFYSVIPPEHWALLDGRPLVWLYSSHWPSEVKADAFGALRTTLTASFAGREPFVVGDKGWEKRARSKVLDARYEWGAALAGPRLCGRIAAVGPGYDDRTVPGRKTPVRDRRGGKFYEQGWAAVLGSDAEIAVVETWNEFHEGTDVCRSREYGAAYIEATRRFADLFRRRERLSKPDGPFARAEAVQWSPAQAEGLALREWEDGLFETVEAGVRSRPNRFGSVQYLYFDLDDSFAFYERADLEVEVEYTDAGRGTLSAQYNGAEEDYDGAGRKRCDGSGERRVATFRLRAACPRNAQNGGADLRLAVEGGPVVVHGVTVRRGR